MLDKLMAGFGKRHDKAKEDALSSYKTKLKGLVYDNDLVEELAPIFARLHGSEGFDKVMSLLETKEAQITSIAGGEWFKQESSDGDNTQETQKQASDEEQTKTLTAEEILIQKYSTEGK